MGTALPHTHTHNISRTHPHNPPPPPEQGLGRAPPRLAPPTTPRRAGLPHRRRPPCPPPFPRPRGRSRRPAAARPARARSRGRRGALRHRARLRHGTRPNAAVDLRPRSLPPPCPRVSLSGTADNSERAPSQERASRRAARAAPRSLFSNGTRKAGDTGCLEAWRRCGSRRRVECRQSAAWRGASAPPARRGGASRLARQVGSPQTELRYQVRTTDVPNFKNPRQI